MGEERYRKTVMAHEHVAGIVRGSELHNVNVTVLHSSLFQMVKINKMRQCRTGCSGTLCTKDGDQEATGC